MIRSCISQRRAIECRAGVFPLAQLQPLARIRRRALLSTIHLRRSRARASSWNSWMVEVNQSGNSPDGLEKLPRLEDQHRRLRLHRMKEDFLGAAEHHRCRWSLDSIALSGIPDTPKLQDFPE